jgi:hypothetical protein
LGAIPKPIGPSEKCIAIVAPALEGIPGNAQEAGAGVRDVIVSYLTGPSVKVITLEAKLASQAREEAKQKGCEPLLFTKVTRKTSGGKVLKALGHAANTTSWQLPARYCGVSRGARGSSRRYPLVFVAMTPCRIIDTRSSSQGFSGPFGAPTPATGAIRTFPVRSNTTCTVPDNAHAYSFNITVVPPGPLGWITAYPSGQSLPLAATVNAPQGNVVGNAAVVAAGAGGSIDIYSSDPTDVVIDINGYYLSNTAGTITSTTLLIHG